MSLDRVVSEEAACDASEHRHNKVVVNRSFIPKLGCHEGNSCKF